MRIIAGELRGRRIEAPPGRSTRPTSDRVREALFSMLASRIGSFDGLRIADLYAGSGALGFEALSRGAAHCSFVETDRAAQQVLKANADLLGLSAKVRLVGASALALPAAEPFDLILADPPYSEGSGSAVVASVIRSHWLAPGGWMSVESERGQAVDDAGLRIEAERQFGRARLTLLTTP